MSNFMSQLPTELLLQILCNLDAFTLHVLVRPTSRRFQTLVETLHPSGIFGLPVSIWSRICRHLESVDILMLPLTSKAFSRLIYHLAKAKRLEHTWYSFTPRASFSQIPDRRIEVHTLLDCTYYRYGVWNIYGSPFTYNKGCWEHAATVPPMNKLSLIWGDRGASADPEAPRVEKVIYEKMGERRDVITCLDLMVSIDLLFAVNPGDMDIRVQDRKLIANWQKPKDGWGLPTGIDGNWLDVVSDLARTSKSAVEKGLGQSLIGSMGYVQQNLPRDIDLKMGDAVSVRCGLLELTGKRWLFRHGVFRLRLRARVDSVAGSDEIKSTLKITPFPGREGDIGEYCISLFSRLLCSGNAWSANF